MKTKSDKGIITRHKTYVRIKNATSGITLIALVITIILLLILAGVVINLSLGENGIFKTTEYAVKRNSEEIAREKLELVLMDLQAYKCTNTDYNENEYIDDYLTNKGMEIKRDIVIVDGWQFEIDRSVPKIISNGSKASRNKSLLGEISYITKSGYYKEKVNEESEDDTVKKAEYNLHVIYHKGDLVLDGITSVEGSTLNNNIYEFGDKNTDVATESENAKNTVVLKIDGNLTINEGVTLTSCKSDNGYGGPKGMIISCSGTITNKGTISMTARGAKAEGENVYLWQNKDETYECVPKVGGSGAAGTKNVKSTYRGLGQKGTNGTNRQSGGGGAGAMFRFQGDGNNYVCNVGNGGNGTSYSGGSGSGGLNLNRRGSGTYTTGSGSSTGGSGGVAIAIYYGGNTGSRGAGGGSGNIGGMGQYNQANNSSLKGSNGTGGLLVLYSKDIINTGSISSNGTKGGNASGENSNYAGGGSSGGGSINIFYTNGINEIKNIQANGGVSNYGGGAGGTGSITIGSIATGSFICEYKNY